MPPKQRLTKNKLQLHELNLKLQYVCTSTPATEREVCPHQWR